MKPHNRSRNIEFFDIGLGGFDTKIKDWTIMTFGAILKRNKHDRVSLDSHIISKIVFHKNSTLFLNYLSTHNNIVIVVMGILRLE